MFGFAAISEMPLSSIGGDTHLGSATLNGAASVSGVPSLATSGKSSISSSGAVSSAGILNKLGQAGLNTGGSFFAFLQLGQARLSTGSPFTNGFSQGFERGTLIVGHGTVAQNHMSSTATIVANGEVTRVGIPAPMLATATLTAGIPTGEVGAATIQSIGSLTGNSVLLHGGSASLIPLARIQARLRSTVEVPDIVAFTLYIDTLRNIDGYISRTQNVTSYIDKQLNITANIDKTNGITGYIDKVVEKTLVRER